MFILRSAFWLTAAFLVIRPDVDVQSAVASMQVQAMEVGKDIVVQQILTPDCDTLCAGRNALLTGTLSSSLSVDPPMQDSSSSPVPLPRPRPDWMG